MCLKGKVIKRYIDEVRPAEKCWELDDVPLTIWLGRNARIGYVDNNHYVICVVHGSVLRPKKKNLEWWINRYKWSLDMYEFLSMGSKAENEFIYYYKLLYESSVALKDKDGRRYRTCIRDMGDRSAVNG